MVHRVTFVTSGDQVSESALLASLSIILPLTVRRVVLLDYLVYVTGELTVEVGGLGVFRRVVKLEHQVVDHHEVVNVVDLALVASQVENLGPDLLIVPLDEVKLTG